jgi:hypothetical protein
VAHPSVLPLRFFVLDRRLGLPRVTTWQIHSDAGELHHRIVPDNRSYNCNGTRCNLFKLLSQVNW